MRSVVTGLVLVALLASVTACDAPARSPRPSSSLVVLDFTPPPSATSSASASPGTSQGGWPLGWDASFCAVFAQAVDAQQLLVDVERALDEGANRDARLLADELIQSAGAATDAIAVLPDWSGATAPSSPSQG